MKILFMTKPIILFLAFILSCSTYKTDLSDVNNEIANDSFEIKKQPIGKECTKNQQCETDFCYFSEFASFGICTKACHNSGELCDNNPDLFCLEFPNDFKGEYKTFCTRVCNETQNCFNFSDKYEKCEKPQYKNNVLYPYLPIKICDNPSNAGKEPINPATCDWSAYKGAHPEVDELCTSFCEYLSLCQHLPESMPTACCEWNCYNKLWQNNGINFDYRTYIDCYIEYFSSFSKTQCSKDKIDDNCSGEPKIPY